MHIPAKVDYGIRALLALAAAGTPQTAEYLAGEQGLPPRFLGAILADLRRAGVVASQRGAEGGYRLAREGNATYIVTTDADGQYNPAEIEKVLAPVVAGEADFVTGSRRLGSQETKDMFRSAGVLFFAGSLSLLTGQRISDTTFGLRAMRAEVTGAVRLEQPQYQASELLIGVITHGYKVAEVPATIHRRRIGESKKGQNPLYGLHLPGVNNLFYGIRFARVIYGTWWRERQRSRSAGRSGSAGPAESAARADSAPRVKSSGPGSVEASASSATAGPGRPADPAKST